jgi:hypothetical protein
MNGSARRVVLASTAVALTASLLAACGSDGDGKRRSDATSASPSAPRPAIAMSSSLPSAPASTHPASVSASSAAAAPSKAPTGTTKAVRPEARMRFDYQIGGAYAPPSGVRAVSRDRSGVPVPGLYNICYINAFQAQPDALAWWQKEHPDLLLRDGGGIVMDADWNEALLDVSTDAKRTKLSGIVGEWIDGCARAGFQAVEPDNFESYSRSRGRLTMDDDVAFARLIAARAHAAGLAIAQKNGAEMLDRSRSIGFDFAVAEECGEYGECGAFASAYGNRVFVVEYAKDSFTKTCAAWRGKLSVVLRDRGVTPAGNPEHVYQAC